jgi:serine/threonine protein kinase
MEYIHYPTLGQYLKNNLSSISFMTKLHFCNLIAQAIRFLTFYDVVHLDIKPDNILIYKKLMIKLIDFGESYCP